jgi:hypothetical protein
MSTVTIQKTSKGLKLQKALAVIAFFGSLYVWAGYSRPLGTVLLAGSFAWGVLVSVLIWWHHE